MALSAVVTALLLALVPATSALAIDEGAARGDQAAIARLYSDYFHRAPDGPGLRYWVDLHGKQNVTLGHISDLFATSAEFLSDYGNLDVPNFVRRVYLNVQGREPDPPGYTYWANLLAYGGLTRGGLMLQFSESPEYVFNSRIIGADRTTLASTGELRPGTYVAVMTDGCYWERLSGLGGTFGEIIANDFTNDAVAYVTIAPTDVAFRSSRCGPWAPLS
jgi:hypothetical protein